jgi:hypothetical protein
MDWRAAGLAAATEAALAGLALHGGPHGALGGWPWMLQLPGILFVVFLGGERYFFGRVAAMLVTQCLVWYGLFAWLRVRRLRLQSRTTSGDDRG